MSKSLVFTRTHALRAFLGRGGRAAGHLRQAHGHAPREELRQLLTRSRLQGLPSQIVIRAPLAVPFLAVPVYLLVFSVHVTAFTRVSSVFQKKEKKASKRVPGTS